MYFSFFPFFTSLIKGKKYYLFASSDTIKIYSFYLNTKLISIFSKTGEHLIICPTGFLNLTIYEHL